MIDIGENGNNAPAVTNGVDHNVYYGLTALIRSRYGYYLMNPTFGFNLSQVISRRLGDVSVEEIILDGIANLDQVTLNKLDITGENGVFDIQAIVEAINDNL